MCSNKVLILLGMHRSRTSLMAKWLHINGINMGDKLLGADVGNEKGHYEDMDFFHLNQEILMDNGLPSGGILFENDEEFNSGFKQIKYTLYHQLKGEAIINFKTKLHQQFGWKDPRTSLLIDFYDEILPDAKYIVIYRHYIDTVNSLIHRKIRKTKNKYQELTFGKIRYLLFGEKRINKIKLKANIYLNGWILYNKKILDFLEKKSNERFVLFSDKDLESKNTQNEILSKIKQWGFEISGTPFSTAFSENPQNASRNKIEFELDPQIVNEAEIVLARLAEYSKKN